MSESDGSEFSYTGTSNLEAMAEAVRYNAFLVDSVAAAMPATGAILDFGAGIGTFASALVARGREVQAVEPDDGQRRQLESSGVVAFVSTAEIADEAFDGAYSLNVLEHIEDDVAALRELHRVLRPDGRLVIYVPAMPWLFTSMDVLVGHVRRYRRSELIDRIASVGFDILDARYVDSIGVVATLAYRLFGSRSGRLSPRSVAIYDRLVFPLSRLADRLLGRIVGKNLLVVARGAK